MKRFITFLGAVIVFTSSCSLEKENFIDTLDNLGYLNAEIITDSLLYGKSTCIKKIGDNLLISLFKGDYVFALYNLKDHTCSYHIRRGKGPGELLHGYFIQKINDSTVLSHNPEVGQISEYRILESTVKWINTQSFRQPFQTIIPIDDSLFLCSANSTKGLMYGTINLQTNSMNTAIEYPHGLNDDLSNRQKASVYRTMLYKHPSKNRIVSIYQKHIIFDFLSYSGSKFKLENRVEIRHFEWSASGNSRPLPSSLETPFSVFSNKNFVTEDKIYLYFEMTNPESGEEYWILAFDWEGNRIGKYRLPFRIDELTYDEKNIYAVALIDNYYEIATIVLE